MDEFTIREYTEKEYRADMQALLEGKGLRGAVEKYTDMIAEDARGLAYAGYMGIVERLNDILYLCELAEGKRNG